MLALPFLGRYPITERCNSVRGLVPWGIEPATVSRMCTMALLRKTRRATGPAKSNARRVRSTALTSARYDLFSRDAARYALVSSTNVHAYSQRPSQDAA